MLNAFSRSLYFLVSVGFSDIRVLTKNILLKCDLYLLSYNQELLYTYGVLISSYNDTKELLKQVAASCFDLVFQHWELTVVIR